jgi:SAM-dependent methyltransferase
MAEAYGTTAYWNERYTDDPDPFDWYQTYAGIKGILAKHLTKKGRVLMAGAGNSTLSEGNLFTHNMLFNVMSLHFCEDMCNDGFEFIANIDISGVVMDQMSKRYSDTPNMSWEQMNVCALDFSGIYIIEMHSTFSYYVLADDSFDAIVDKGTIDCVLCGEHAVAATNSMIAEAWRVLKPGGHYVGISYGTPDSRLPLFAQEDCDWEVAHYSVPKPINSTPAGSADSDEENGSDGEKCHYIYICQKR